MFLILNTSRHYMVLILYCPKDIYSNSIFKLLRVSSTDETHLLQTMFLI